MSIRCFITLPSKFANVLYFFLNCLNSANVIDYVKNCRVSYQMKYFIYHNFLAQIIPVQNCLSKYHDLRLVQSSTFLLKLAISSEKKSIHHRTKFYIQIRIPSKVKCYQSTGFKLMFLCCKDVSSLISNVFNHRNIFCIM